MQNPTTSLAADVAATNQILDEQDGDVVLVGHSYGGVVITEAGRHPKVKRLVYITAFAPDTGESVASLIANPPPGAPVPPILPPKDGFLFLDRAKFAASFAADVEPAKADFMARSQVPWGVEALQGAATAPAWKTKPSFYLVVTEDGMIPPPGAADDGAAGRRHRARDRRQPRHLRLQARARGGDHRIRRRLIRRRRDAPPSRRRRTSSDRLFRADRCAARPTVPRFGQPRSRAGPSGDPDLQ